MNEITITTYDKSPKNKNKQRKQKIDIDIDINNILALTTARGDNSKWPKIYVLDYNEPLELPEQSFNDIKNRLLKATKNDSNSENLIFIPVGPKVLVNYHRVFQIKKLTREIVFCNDTVLDDFDEQSLTEFESQVEIIKQREKEQHDNYYRCFWDNFGKLKKKATSRRESKFSKLFGSLENKMVIIVFLMLINITLSFSLIILIGILLSKL